MEWLTVAAPSDLRVILDGMPVAGRMRLVRLEAHHVWHWRGELGIVSNEGLWAEYQDEVEAAGRRRTLAEAGVNAADWPEEQREPDRVVTRWVTDTGDVVKESAMADALRRILDEGAD